MVVCFCGHGKEIYTNDVHERLYRIVEELINKGAGRFLLGGYGNFDMLAARTVYELKTKYPHIRSELVLPYPDRKYDAGLYNGSVYPPIENVPRRFAIVRRNEWIVQQADVVIAYVTHDWGGAARMLRYAEKKGKVIAKI